MTNKKKPTIDRDQALIDLIAMFNIILTISLALII